MNNAEALKFLSLEADASREVVEGVLEEKLFTIKKEILNLIPVPSLVTKRMNQLSSWVEIEDFYFSPPSRMDFSPPSRMDGILLGDELAISTDAITFLETYEREISIEKLEIANVSTFIHLIDCLVRIIHLQECYMSGFKKFFSTYNEALPEEVKSREMIDTGKLLQALKNNAVNSEITWEVEKELGRINKLLQFKENH